MSEAMIEVKNFCKLYDNFVAVDNISFTVHQGEIFGLLGPNGAGKTSTLESLEGLRPPNGGTLWVAGVDPAAAPHKLRNLIGVQLQSAGLPASITAGEAMKLFCAYHGVAPRFDLLDRLGLTGKRNVEFQGLSTGMQRRLSLALAVAHEPPVLFLDEPTAGLDVASRVELHNLMRELKEKGTTTILATHDMAEAEEMSDRVAILLPATHAMNALNGLAMGGTADFYPWGSILTLFVGGLTAFRLAWYLFRWDSQSSERRGHPLMALLALLPYAAWLLIV